MNAFISFILLVLLTSPGGRDLKLHYQKGLPLETGFTAPFDLSITDEGLLKKKQAQLASTQYVRVDVDVRQRAFHALDEVINKSRKAHDQAASGKPVTESSAYKDLLGALQQLGLKPDQATEDARLLAQKGVTEKLANELRNTLIELYDERGTASSFVHSRLKATVAAGHDIVWNTKVASVPRTQYDPDRIIETPGEVALYLRRVLPGNLSVDRDSRAVFERLFTSIVEPVITLDDEGRQQAMADLERNRPQKIYKQGDVVVAPGAIVGDESENVLRQFEAQQRFYSAVTTIGIAAFVALFFALVTLYVRKFPNEMPNAPSSVILISAPMIVSFLVWRWLETFHLPALAGYGFPSALVGMLSVVLLGPRFAWLLVTCSSLLFGIAAGFNFPFALVALFGGFTAVTTLYSTRTRWDILTSAGIVSMVNALVILAISFIQNPNEISRETANAVSYGVGNGLLCGALVFPLLWLMERAFGVVTDFALLELTGTIHPLIRELEEKAPGSYQHTLNVTKLAEAAAREIGANYLLVRAGGYFHDIGKIEKPRYFSENQLTQDDRALHAKLSPYMSTLIIKNHVKEGIELAMRARGRYKLPREVIAFIPEHQGTSLITYFYRQALRQFQDSESTDPVHEEDFRYQGPRPQSIETAIVMLADSVEATVTAVFTSTNVNEDELRRVVRKSINDKFDDGQFNECDLTLRDLHLISESFVKTLLGRFHHRVQYPDAPKTAAAAQGGVRRAGAPLNPPKPRGGSAPVSV